MVIEKVEVVPVRSTPGRRIPERRRIIKEKYKKLCVSKNRPWQTPSGGKNTQLSDKKSRLAFFSSSTNYFQRVYSQCPTAVWTPAGCMMPLLLKLQVLIAKLVSVQTWTNSEHSGRENFKLIYLHIFSPKTLTSFNKHPIFLHRFLNWKVLNIVRSDRGLNKAKKNEETKSVYLGLWDWQRAC